MKRFLISLLTVLLLCASLLFASCGDDEDQKPPPESPAPFSGEEYKNDNEATYKPEWN